MSILSYAYPAQFEPVSLNEVLVRFPDFPEVLTSGEDLLDARGQAADALDEAVLARLAADQDIPAPRDASGDEVLIALDPTTAARALFARVIATRNLSKVAAAQFVGRDERQIRRILDGRGSVRMEHVLEALRVFGIRPTLTVDVPAEAISGIQPV